MTKMQKMKVKLYAFMGSRRDYEFSIVEINCNQGMSRSPGIGMFYLARKGVIKNDSFHEALAEFETIYPGINMAGGMHGFLMENWTKYTL